MRTPRPLGLLVAALSISTAAGASFPDTINGGSESSSTDVSTTSISLPDSMTRTTSSKVTWLDTIKSGFFGSTELRVRQDVGSAASSIVDTVTDTAADSSSSDTNPTTTSGSGDDETTSTPNSTPPSSTPPSSTPPSSTPPSSTPPPSTTSDPPTSESSTTSNPDSTTSDNSPTAGPTTTDGTSPTPTRGTTGSDSQNTQASDAATTPPPSSSKSTYTSTYTTVFTTTGVNGQVSPVTSIATTTGTATLARSTNGSDSDSSGLSSQQRNIVIGVCVGVGGFAIIAGGVAYVFWKLRGRKKAHDEAEDLIGEPKPDSLGQAGAGPSGAPNNGSQFTRNLESYHKPYTTNASANF